MKKSIARIEKVYETGGSHPILILCDDIKSYVVKYKTGQTATNLFKEYISARFLQLWSLGVPNFDFISVAPEHVPMGVHPNIQPNYFNTTCFGSEFSRNYQEVTNFLHQAPISWKQQFIYVEELFMIALFDIWMANEDRNFNNPNLMYDVSNGNRFVPIDHQYVFNSSSIDRGLSQLTYNESIMYHPSIKDFVKKRKLINNLNVDELKDNYYLCVNKCRRNVEKIIKEIPLDWNIPPEQTLQLINKELFLEDWVRRSWHNFHSHLQ